MPSQPRPSAPRSVNFAFLAKHDPLLLRTAAQAERYVFDDPSTALIKLRLLSDLLAREVAARSGIRIGESADFLAVLRELRDGRVLPREVAELFHGIRMAGNQAAHQGTGERRDALHHLRMARELAIWFHRAFGNEPHFKAGS